MWWVNSLKKNQILMISVVLFFGPFGIYEIVHGETKVAKIMIGLYIFQTLIWIFLFGRGTSLYLAPQYCAYINMRSLFYLILPQFAPVGGDFFEEALIRPLLWVATLPGSILTLRGLYDLTRRSAINLRSH